MDVKTIKSWFRKGLKPTQEQFWALIDSFRHKDDPILMSEVHGLAETLEGKSDKEHTHSLSDITDIDNFKVGVDAELSSTSENPVQNKVIALAIDQLKEKTNAINKSYDIIFEHKDSLVAFETNYKQGGINIKRISALNVGSLELAIVNKGIQNVSLMDGGIDKVTGLRISTWEYAENGDGISADYLDQLIWTITKVNSGKIAGISVYYE